MRTSIALLVLSFSGLALANSGTYDMAVNQGCESGKNAAGQSWHKFQKDVDKYINDPYYKNGWDDGFAQCKGEADNVNRAVDDALSNNFR